MVSSTILNMTAPLQRLGRDTEGESMCIPDMLFAISAYGGRPVNSSITVHAKDQISDFVDAPLSSMTSGAIQFGVPATSLISRSIARRLRETPKSESFTFPFFVVKIFAAFKSQWTTSHWCK